jgi:hypothetical protein
MPSHIHEYTHKYPYICAKKNRHFYSYVEIPACVCSLNKIIMLFAYKHLVIKKNMHIFLSRFLPCSAHSTDVVVRRCTHTHSNRHIPSEIIAGVCRVCETYTHTCTFLSRSLPGHLIRMCVYRHICIYIYIYICIHTHTHISSQTILVVINTHKHTYTHTYIHTYTHWDNVRTLFSSYIRCPRT